MRKEVGDPKSQIWLLGDSNPRNWESVLDTPLDPRHPARHNIWTSVLDVVQDTVFRSCGERVDASSLYIRNAIESPNDKPRSNIAQWGHRVEEEIASFKDALLKHQPRLLLTFGAFAFEFARRSLGEQPSQRHSHWGARALGKEFRARLARFDLTSINVLPLLHVSVSRGRFIQAHEQFCGQEGANYFNYAGAGIADKLIEHRHALRVWIRREQGTGS